jgi:hypothetical protein
MWTERGLLYSEVDTTISGLANAMNPFHSNLTQYLLNLANTSVHINISGAPSECGEGRKIKEWAQTAPITLNEQKTHNRAEHCPFINRGFLLQR